MISSLRRSGIWQLDLALVAIMTVTALLAVLALADTILRLPFVFLLVVFTPGYAVLSSLILSSGLSVLERIGISVGTSIAITIVCGLVMGLLGIEITAVNWVSALSLVTLSGVAIAWGRRAYNSIPGPSLVVPGMPIRQAAVLVLALLIFADVALVSRVIGGDQLGGPPEQLWMLPVDGSPNAELGMRAGVEGGQYVIRVSSAGAAIDDYPVELAASEIWQETLELTAQQRELPIVARLYAGDSDVELRYVVLQPMDDG